MPRPSPRRPAVLVWLATHLVVLPASFAEEPATAPAAPNARISGQILARGTRTPLVGATVLEGDYAAEAGADGEFSLEVKPGELDLQVVAAGYERATFHERLGPAESLRVVYRLQPLEVNPYEVTVRAARDRTEVSRVSLERQELREVPGTSGDPLRVMMLMPGVAGLGSAVAYPVVRGSQPAATGYFMDGIRVPMLFHLLLGPAVFHPDFIDSIDFRAGTSDAGYGRLIGGVVDVKPSRPHDDRVHASAYADLVNAGVFLETPIASTGTNVTLAGRVSYSALAIALMANVLQGPGENAGKAASTTANFWDYQARVEQPLKDGKLRLLLFGSSDMLVAGSSEPDAFVPSADTGFHRADLRYRHGLGGGELEVGATLGRDGLAFLATEAGERVGEVSAIDSSIAARALWKRAFSDTLSLQLGADLERRWGDVVMFGVDAVEVGKEQAHELREPSAIATIAGAFAQAVWKPTPRWTVSPGLRVDSYALLGGQPFVTAEPRISTLFSISDRLLWKVGAGYFHQPPTMLVPVPVVGLSGLRYGLQSALQFDTGIEWKQEDGFELSADVYFNPLLRTVEFDPIRVVDDRRRAGLPQVDPASHGYAYGFELMARRALTAKWFGWLSYGFQQSRRFATFERYDAQNHVIGTAEGYLPFAFEQAHVLNAALNYKFGRGWTAGATVHFNTGRPESGQLSSRTRRFAVDEAGNEIAARVDLDRVDRLPAYFRLDARVAYAWAMESFHLELYLDVYNLSVTQEVLGFTYAPGPNVPPDYRKRPFDMGLIVLPMLGVKGTY